MRCAARVAALGVVGLLPLGGACGVGGGRPAGVRPVGSEPRLTATEASYIGRAWRAVVVRDHACNGFHGPEVTDGTPSPELSSRFAILRRPASSAGRLRRWLSLSGPPGGPAWTAGAQLYTNQIHRARSAFGATFYVLQAGNVSGQRGVPARCGPEQVAALERRLSELPPRRRSALLAAQSRYLAYLRYLALHPDGICATFLLRRGLGDNFGCATLASFRHWGVLADTQAYLGGHVAVWWTVVPDGVATVTLRFGGPPGSMSGGSNGATVTARVLDNLVVIREPVDAPSQSGFPSTIVLGGADGRILEQLAVTPAMPTLCGYGC